MLQRGDVVNLKPEYIKYALSNGVHYGEDIAGGSWVVDCITTAANCIDRLIYVSPVEPGGGYLEMITGPAVPERALEKNEFLTSVYQASESRRNP